MKLGPVIKDGKKKISTSKKFADDIMSKNCNLIVFFQYITNLQPSGSQILDTWSIKLTFSLIITFYLTEPENRTKKSFTPLLHYCFE